MMRVLIVDDHPLNRKLLRVRLEAEGVEVLDAADGRDALMVLDRSPQVDAIVSDILMPNMDGYRFCYEVRNRPNLRHLPFVFYSNTYSTPSDEKLAMEIGGDAFLPKPVGADRVLGVLQSLIARPSLPARSSEVPENLAVMKQYSELLVRKLEEQLSELRVSVREKEGLLKEVQHRVKNNLQVISSLLRLESGRAEQAETRSVLEDLQARIQAMSVLHETLYGIGTFAATDLAEYLNQLARQTFTAFVRSPRHVGLELELTSLHVDMDKAVPCGLIVNELISNALKHAFPGERSGRILLRLDRAGTRARVTVQDDGVGLADDFNRRPSSIGLQLVRDLAVQLEGEVRIIRDSCTAFEVTFPT